MVTIITGDKNTGKTTYMESWYTRDSWGVGFLSRKVFDSGRFVGYDLVLLPGGEYLPLCRLDGQGEKEGISRERGIGQGRFIFDSHAFREASCWVNAYPLRESEPVWIDEIGALELSGRGFDALLRTVLAKGHELRVVFREHLFDSLLNHYSITEYNVLRDLSSPSDRQRSS